MPIDGELNADEFFDVYRVFRPMATREEFDLKWNIFQAQKALREKEKSIQ